MSSPGDSRSFAQPAMRGDAVHVLVLVEDSGPMAAKWPDVRAAYVPALLEHLRSADSTVEMSVHWLTASPAYSPPPTTTQAVADVNACYAIPDVPFDQTVGTRISAAAVGRAIATLASATKDMRHCTRHMILVASSGPDIGAPTGLSGFDAWDDIARTLTSEYIRLHVVLSIGAEMRVFHELFKRSLQMQNNSEVPPWFQVDSRKYSIRLAGRPQYVRSSVSAPALLPHPTVSPPAEGTYSNTSPTSTPSMSPPAAPTPTSPPTPQPNRPRKSASVSSPTTITTTTTASIRPKARDGELTNDAPALVSFLQQMHGLTKKKSYGVKAPKKTMADVRLSSAGRPILPRLEVPPSDIYTYPTFPEASTEPERPSSSRKNSLDTPGTSSSSSLVARTANREEERRARRRGPWLPVAPLSPPNGSTGSSPPGTIAALNSLASMTPRLPDFASSPPRTRTPQAQPYPPPPTRAETYGPPAGYYAGSSLAAGSRATLLSSVSASPISSGSPSVSTSTSASSPASSISMAYARPRYSAPSSYSQSPPSSQASTPHSLAAPTPEDEPFIITPEYEASVNARFDEAVRSGDLQASMSGVLPYQASAASAAATSLSPYPPAPAAAYYTGAAAIQQQGYVQAVDAQGFPAYYAAQAVEEAPNNVAYYSAVYGGPGGAGQPGGGDYGQWGYPS